MLRELIQKCARGMVVSLGHNVFDCGSHLQPSSCHCSSLEGRLEPFEGSCEIFRDFKASYDLSFNFLLSILSLFLLVPNLYLIYFLFLLCFQPFSILRNQPKNRQFLGFFHTLFG